MSVNMVVLHILVVIVLVVNVLVVNVLVVNVLALNMHVSKHGCLYILVNEYTCRERTCQSTYLT